MRKSAFKRLRARRRMHGGEELALAAMVDMMINLLVFLLFLYGSDPIDAPPGPDMELSESSATEAVRPSVAVVITVREISVEGIAVQALIARDGVPALPENTVVAGDIPNLADRLRDELSRAEDRARRRGAEWEPELMIQSDRRVPWAVLQPVVHSAGSAG